ncbi:MAG: hypothetical protein AAYR33_08135 [Acetobacteraceae bacterium]
MTGQLAVTVTYSGGRGMGGQYDGGLIKQMGPYQQIGSITGPYDISSLYCGYLIRLYDATGSEHKFSFRSDNNVYTQNGRLLNFDEDMKTITANIKSRVDQKSYDAKVVDLQNQLYQRPGVWEYDSTDNRVIWLPFGGMIQSFKTGSVNIFDRINFPQVFSNITSITCTLFSNTGQRRDVTIGRLDNGGFFVMSNIDGGELFVQVIGQR